MAGAGGSSSAAARRADACALAQAFLEHGVEVVLADVLTEETRRLCRRLLPDVVIVHLQVSLTQARRRAATRTVCLRDEEFEALHRADRTASPAADHRLDVTSLTLSEQVDAVERVWSAHPVPGRTAGTGSCPFTW